MFKCSLTTFPKETTDLFTPAAFSSPPRLAAPLQPAHWVSYDGPASGRPDAFAAFRASPDFQTAREQFFERIAQCKDFAHAHCSTNEALAIADGFDTFAQELADSDSPTYFNRWLERLYGEGKRDFDRFCLRLAQDDLDLHRRKTVLRELASELPTCRASGAAFMDAARGLDQSPGGLHAEFHDVLMLHINEHLRQFVRRLQARECPTAGTSAQDHDPLDTMEVHVVNRLKVELGLPGHDPHDPVAAAFMMVSADDVDECLASLRADLRPVMLARHLADRYMDQLRGALPAGLQAPDADLSDSLPLIRSTVNQLNATYGTVPLHHLLEEDDTHARTHWQTDLSLLTHDLLQGLARHGLIVPKSPAPLVHGHHDGRDWDLMHVDWRLFLVGESPSGRSTPGTGPRAALQLLPVHRHPAAQWLLRDPRAPHVARPGNRLIQLSPTQALRTLPASALSNDDKCRIHCERLGDEGMRAWLIDQPFLPRVERQRLVRVLTALNLPIALSQATETLPQHEPADWPTLCGGAERLTQTLATASDAVKQVWLDRFKGAMREMSDDQIETLFSGAAPCLIGHVMKTGTAFDVHGVMDLMRSARAEGRVRQPYRHLWLNSPNQDLMRQGRLAALQAYGDCLKAMLARGDLDSARFAALLTGRLPEHGCQGALEGGQPEVVRWFHTLVRHAWQEGLLPQARASRMVSSTPQGDDSGARVAVRHGHAESLREHLTQLIQAVADGGMVLHVRLPELLACADAIGHPGLGPMLTEPVPSQCLDAWRSCVIDARDRALLPHADIEALVAARAPNGVPLLHALVRRPDARECVPQWLRLLRELMPEPASPAVHRLLAADIQPPRPGQSLLCMLMKEADSPVAVQALDVWLEATLTAAAEGALTGDQWCGLLRPSPDSPEWRALERCPSEAMRQCIDQALAQADARGWLDHEAGHSLRSAWQALRTAQGFRT